MGVKTDPAAAAIDNARAMLETFLASDWKEIHVASAELELFIARDSGGANPMRAALPANEGSALEAPAAGAHHEVKAPHVATLVSVVPEGTWVEQGEPVARLSVLDEEEDLPAPVSGRLASATRNAGDLVEFGDVLLTLEEAA
ncbi:biotin/lipoyl-containing protein [Novosphingobium sp. 9U]|uniref:biotin/lipoyl-containing protein n=1 Tax=Novosphingobium sp. 9U TaxID=2653158 RepID=UPI0012F2FD38|nr:biotin/lipoyl-containing protein [Novosphingobium sp. 9U]VWX54160.1 conserved hypothetical protein [Novosphingobium sp. 9U]